MRMGSRADEGIVEKRQEVAIKHSHLSLKVKQLTFAVMASQNGGRKGSGYIKLATTFETSQCPSNRSSQILLSI